jgi:5-guanidino-2-oxopentanoate decarboxylase
MMTFGEVIIKHLEAYGVDTVFGIPGVHNLELYRGLANSNIKHILTRHEQGAGFMAYGYAAISKKPGVCFVISGPGLTNITTPMGQAYSDSIPMLVISSDAPSDTLGKGWGYLHEVTDLTAVSKPLTAFSSNIKLPDELPQLLEAAFQVFHQRARPVHLAIALDVLRKETSLGDIQTTPAPERLQPDSSLIEKAVALLESSENPCLVVGGGAVDCGKDIQHLAEAFAASVITTNAGKGIIPEHHPLSLGTTLTLPSMQEHLSQADVVLAIGTELADTEAYNHKHLFSGKLIRIDIDKNKLCDLYPAEVAIHADAALAVRAVKNGIQHLSRSSEAMQLKVAKLKQEALDNLSPLEQKHYRLLTLLRQTLADDAVVVSDMTQLAYSATPLFPMNQPDCWLHPTGYGSLGFALPVAIGAKFAAIKREVIALIGDAGFQYTLQELGTAVEHNLGLPILLWNNDALGEIERSMTAIDIPPIHIRQHNPDFLMLAKAYGCDAICADTAEIFAKSIKESFSKDKPTLIEVRQDSSWL